MPSRRLIAIATVIAVLGAGAVVWAQDFFGPRRQSSDVYAADNVEYDGRLTFVRIRYQTGFGGGFGRRAFGREPAWAHDYPTADIHMMKILAELSITPARTDGSNILTLDDPELFRYPIAYMSEPGYWVPSDAEAQGLRNYLLKGGFIIFDDFRTQEGHWYNLEEQMRRVLPALRFVQIDGTHPIFHAFFSIENLEFLTSYGGLPPTYWALFEDNDPRKRMLALANRDNDLGEYWEYSATGLFPVDLSNEAYKFGMNYIIYGLTH